MGFTTIVELNNDYLPDIEKDPERFVFALRAQIASSGDSIVSLPGGKVVAMFHRDDGESRDWIKFKKALGWK